VGEETFMVDEGLVAITPRLTLERLFSAYSQGCFPWSGRPARWYCPDPRAVFEIPKIHFSRRLLRQVRRGNYEVSFDRSFRAVITACADFHATSWVDDEIIEKFVEFHEAGFAHSVEVWDEEELIGGLYGVHIAKMFCGESMFHQKSNASKIAFYHLVEKLKELEVELFDAQVINPHTQSLGAVEIPRSEFLRRVKSAVEGDGPLSVEW
jgi:leucyl/phenylalanyl-tRNA--protein transferase